MIKSLQAHDRAVKRYQENVKQLESIGADKATAILNHIEAIIESEVNRSKFKVVYRDLDSVIRTECEDIETSFKDLMREYVEYMVFNVLDAAGYKVTLWQSGDLLIQWSIDPRAQR